MNPTRLTGSRAVRVCLEEVGFDLRDRHSGLYERPGVDLDMRRATRIDVFVPAAFEYAWSADGYDARAAMVQPVLEACLVDYSPMELTTLDDGGVPLSATVHVAGFVALLAAKGWNIGERYEQGPEAFADVRKDIGDIYRLLQTSDAHENTATLRSLRDNRHISGERLASYLDIQSESGRRAHRSLHWSRNLWRPSSRCSPRRPRIQSESVTPNRATRRRSPRAPRAASRRRLRPRRCR